ncbi:unnamed protein product, partial [Ectocarpus sp. 6 AP-2014]
SVSVDRKASRRLPTEKKRHSRPKTTAILRRTTRCCTQEVQQQRQQERLPPRGHQSAGGGSRLCATGNMDRSLAEHSGAPEAGTQQPAAKTRGGESSQ